MKTTVEEKYTQYCYVTPTKDIVPLFQLRDEIQASRERTPASSIDEDEALGYLLDALVSIYAKPLQEHIRIANEHAEVSTGLANRAAAIREAGLLRAKLAELGREHGAY